MKTKEDIVISALDAISKGWRIIGIEEGDFNYSLSDTEEFWSCQVIYKKTEIYLLKIPRTKDKNDFWDILLEDFIVVAICNLMDKKDKTK